MDRMAPGGGGRFAALKRKLARNPKIYNPGAVAAKIGRKKYTAHGMAEMAAAGRARHAAGTAAS